MRREVRAAVSTILRHRYPLIVFAILSLPPFFWLQGHAVGWGDTGLINFFYNSDHLTDTFQYQWMGRDLMGGPYGWAATLLPMTAVSGLMSSVGLGYYAQQALVFSSVLFVSMAAMYFFVLLFLGGGEGKRLTALGAALFYAYNPMSLIVYWYPGLLNLYLLPFVPLVALLLLLALRRSSFAWIVLLALVIALFSIVFVNPSFLVAPAIIFASLFAYEVARNKRSGKGARGTVKAGVLILVSILLLSAWFLLPMVMSSGYYFEASTAALDPKTTLVDMSRSVSAQSMLRFVPLDSDTPIWAYKDPAWRFFYDNPLFVLIGALALLVALVPIISRKRTWSAAMFTILMLLGVTLCLGLSSPLGGVYGYLFDNVSVFQAFRIPYSKFMPLVLFPAAVLFGMGLARLEETPKWFGRIGFPKGRTVIAAFLIVGVYALPMWAGSSLSSPITIRGGEISSMVEVPGYYREMAQFLSEDEGSYRVVSLPLRPYGFVGLDWQFGYDGPDYTWLMLESDVIADLGNDPTRSSEVAGMALNDVEENLAHLMRLTASKYVIVQRDVEPVRGNYGGIALPNQTELTSAMENLGATLVVSIGQLDLYRLPFEPSPRVYADTRPVVVEGGVEQMYRVLSSREYEGNGHAIFLTDSLTDEQASLILAASGSVLVPSNERTESTRDGSERPFDWSELPPGLFQPVYYDGWKSVVRTDGQEQESALSFSTPVRDVVGAWWLTDWMGMGTKEVVLPFTIPANQVAIIELPVDLSPSVMVELVSNGSATTVSVPVEDGLISEFEWSNLGSGEIEARYFEGWKAVIRTDGADDNDSLVFPSLDECPYVFPDSSPDGWSGYNSTLIYLRTGDEPLTISSLHTAGLGPCPYEFPATSPSGWSAYNSTLVYILAGTEPFRIDEVLVDGGPANVVGAWWTSSWMGMGTNEIRFPIVVPPGERAIIELAVESRNVTLSTLDLSGLEDPVPPADGPEIVFTKTSPVRYEVEIRATSPFFLTLAEAFHPQWKANGRDGGLDAGEATISYLSGKVREITGRERSSFGDISLLAAAPVDERFHVVANGYANSWLIDPAQFDLDGDGVFSLTLYYAEQSNFHAGILISIGTAVIFALYVGLSFAMKRWRKGKQLSASTVE